jgi:alginate O-acetyltransferase complex protein AlgI
MVFSSPIFICVFLPLVLAAYYALPKSANNAVLVGASLIFYAWGDPLAALFLVIPSVVINFHFGKLIGAAAEKRRRHWIVTSAITFNLALLVVFKYLPFIVTNVNIGLDAIGIAPLRVPQITLPLGISFFTFHIIPYLVDIIEACFHRSLRLPPSHFTSSTFPNSSQGRSSATSRW